MNSRRLLGLVLLLNLVACAALAVYFQRERHLQVAENEAFAGRRAPIEKERANLREQLKLLHEKAGKAAADRRQAEARATAANSPRSSDAAVHATNAPTTGGKREAFDAKRSDAVDTLRTMPEYVSYMVRNARRNVMRSYGDAIDALGLSAEKAEKLKQLLIDRELAQTDASLVAQRQGESANGPAATELLRQIEKETQAKTLELLGEADFAKFREQTAYSNARRAFLDDCNVVLAEGGIPTLTNDQMFACFRGNSAVQHVSQPPALTREAWTEYVRPHVVGVLSTAQFDVFVEHTYAWIRQSMLRQQATQQASRKG